MLPANVRIAKLKGKVVARFEVVAPSALGPAKQNAAEIESQLRSSVVDKVTVCLKDAFP